MLLIFTDAIRKKYKYQNQLQHTSVIHLCSKQHPVLQVSLHATYRKSLYDYVLPDLFVASRFLMVHVKIYD